MMDAQPITSNANPYVGPRPFTRLEGHLYFGREREARDLLSLIVSERLVLFYAQSGAGKSSLINTRLIPGLEARGFEVLPIGRISGAPPTEAALSTNVFVYNLIHSLIKQGWDGAAFRYITLDAFLPNLAQVGDTYQHIGKADDVDNLAPLTSLTAPESGEEDVAPIWPRALIIDQFEEIFTTNPQAWQQRTAFFDQLNQAMVTDPYLWVVLTLREDYVAALDPYAHRLADNMRARYYMQRMGINAALAAIQAPATNAGRSFAPGVAEELVDNLRQVQNEWAVEGQETSLGEFIEPVQLQVVCYQLWEKQRGEPGAQITLENLTSLAGAQGLAHFVNQVLADYYEQALTKVLQLPGLTLSERALRDWFSTKLITLEETRGFVHQGDEETDGLPNSAIRLLADQFLIRAETRAGGVWYELIHDRFIQPILQANRAWESKQANPLTAGALLWLNSGRDPQQLLRDRQLEAAQNYALEHVRNLRADEEEFLKASLRQQDEETRLAATEARRKRMLTAIGACVAIFLVGVVYWGWRQSVVASANAALANQQRIQGMVQQAQKLTATDALTDAIKIYEQAKTLDPTQNFSAELASLHVTLLVQAGERQASIGNLAGAGEKFTAALALKPASTTPHYVWVPSGEFIMGSVEGPGVQPDEGPQTHLYELGFWILSTEVTNAQYRRCLQVHQCTPPDNHFFDRLEQANRPVNWVNWDQAIAYAHWVGGRLPSEAEWEKACRGVEGWTHPWGNDDPTPERLNYFNTVGSTTDVGVYPPGGSPYGAYDMLGNVWEWTRSLYKPYPYQPFDGREGETGGGYRVARGTAFAAPPPNARCAKRAGDDAGFKDQFTGFRVLIPGPAQLAYEEGGKLAWQGKQQDALAKFEAVLRLDPKARLEPATEVETIMAQGWVQKGETLAASGDITAAIAQFQKARTLNPHLQIIPEMEARRLAGQNFLEKGYAIAKTGDITEVTALFAQALELAPNLRANLSHRLEFTQTQLVKPEIAARRAIARANIDRGYSLVKDGFVRNAINAYNAAQALDPTLPFHGEDWYMLCRYGSMYSPTPQQAATMLVYCNRALALEPDNGNFHEARGLAYALSGDYRNAIKDLQIYVEWSKDPQHYEYDPYGQRYLAWIAELQAGNNPFDARVLRLLR